MPPLRTTLGQILVNEALPEDLRDYNRVMNAKAMEEILEKVADKYPDRYREVSHKLLKAGKAAAYSTGGLSFGLRHMQTSAAYSGEKEKLNQQIQQILKTPDLTPEQKNQAVIKAVGKVHYDDDLASKVLKQGVAEQNPLALQVLSGGRGNPSGLKRLIAADGLYQDHLGNIIPIAILNSYSHGVDPAEFLAATFGARQGLVDTKLGTAKGGYLSKQMSNAVHRLIVSEMDKEDDPDEEPNLRGLLTETSDMDNVGALLSAPAGGYDRNTVITPRVLKDLKNKGIDKIVVRSPLAGGPRGGGLYARDVGVTSRMNLPSIGEAVGIPASQSISERIIQTSLNSKHRGGTTGRVGGFNLLNQMINIPKEYPSGAAHSEVDGRVSKIEDAPAGGKLVTVDNKQHYVPVGSQTLVNIGDEVEAGDVLSDGIPNPAKVVAAKGIGEGRRYFVKTYMQALADSGVKAKRRNVELLARGLIDHVQADEEFNGHFPGDTLSYSDLENEWEPRPGTSRTSVGHSKGKYLEQPVLHYSLGTKIRPSVIKELQEAGVKDIDVNPDPIPFSPVMVRAIDSVSKDSDWMTRMLGGGAEKSMLKAVHLGQSTDPRGTSFVPGLALDPYNFGREGKIKNFTPVEGVVKLSAETKVPGLAKPPEPPQPQGMTPSANAPFAPQLPTTGTTTAGPNISSGSSTSSSPSSNTAISSVANAGTAIGSSTTPGSSSGGAPKLNAQLNQAPPQGAAQRLTPTPGINGSNRGVGNNSITSPKIKGPPSSFQDLMGSFSIDDLSFNPQQFLKNLGQSTRPLLAPTIGQHTGLPGLFAYNDLVERGGANVGDLFTAGNSVPKYKRWDGSDLTGNEYAEARQLGVGWQPKPVTPLPPPGLADGESGMVRSVPADLPTSELGGARGSAVDPGVETRGGPSSPELAGVSRQYTVPGNEPVPADIAQMAPPAPPAAPDTEKNEFHPMLTPAMAAFATAGTGLRTLGHNYPALGAAGKYLQTVPAVNNKATRFAASFVGADLDAFKRLKGFGKALPVIDLAIQAYRDGIATPDQRRVALAALEAGKGQGGLSSLTFGLLGNELGQNTGTLGQAAHAADQLAGAAMSPIKTTGAIVQGAGDASAMGNAAKHERAALEQKRQEQGLATSPDSGYDAGTSWGDRRLQDVAGSGAVRAATHVGTELVSAPGEEFERGNQEAARREKLMAKRVESLKAKQQSGVQLTPVEQAELDRANGNSVQRHDPGLSYSQRATEDVAALPSAGFGSFIHRRPVVIPGTNWNINWRSR